VLNMIKMDVYRMFRTKSMYVIWIILLASALLTSFLSKIDYDAANKEWEKQQAVESQADTDTDMQAADVVNAQDIEQQQAADSNKEQLSQQNTDNVNLGMSVELPTEPGKKVTVMDVFFSNAQGKFYALFLVIFAVMFATADIKSGYIKNIGGQVSQRGMLIASRAVALALFTAITFAGIFVFQAAANMLAFKCVVWGDWKEIIPYFLTEFMLHYAFVLICMAIAVIIKNNVISMTLSVCLTMNIMSIVYALIDYVGNRVGLHNFNIYKYTVTGKMAMLPMNAGREDIISSMCVAATFIIIMLSLSSYIFQKRDI
jgi:ABC-2 type transport system permease protein